MQEIETQALKPLKSEAQQKALREGKVTYINEKGELKLVTDENPENFNIDPITGKKIEIKGNLSLNNTISNIIPQNDYYKELIDKRLVSPFAKDKRTWENIGAKYLQSDEVNSFTRTMGGLGKTFAGGFLNSIASWDLSENSSEGNSLQRVAKRLQESAARYNHIYDNPEAYMDNIEDFTISFGTTLGMAAENAVEYALFGGLLKGATLGLKNIKAAKTAKNLIQAKNAGKMLTGAKNAAMGTLAGIKEARANSWETADQAFQMFKEAGYTDKDAQIKAEEAAAINFQHEALALGALNALQYMVFLGGVKKLKSNAAVSVGSGFSDAAEGVLALPLKKIKNNFTRGALLYLAAGASEGVEEGAQGGIQQNTLYEQGLEYGLLGWEKYDGLKFDDDMKTQILQGFLGGMLMGASGQVLQIYRGKQMDNAFAKNEAAFISDAVLTQTNIAQKVRKAESVEDVVAVNHYKQLANIKAIFNGLLYDQARGESGTKSMLQTYIKTLRGAVKAVEEGDSKKLEELGFTKQDEKYIRENFGKFADIAEEIPKQYLKNLNSIKAKFLSAFSPEVSANIALEKTQKEAYGKLWDTNAEGHMNIGLDIKESAEYKELSEEDKETLETFIRKNKYESLKSILEKAKERGDEIEKEALKSILKDTRLISQYKKDVKTLKKIAAKDTEGYYLSDELSAFVNNGGKFKSLVSSAIGETVASSMGKVFAQQAKELSTEEGQHSYVVRVNEKALPLARNLDELEKVKDILVKLKAFNSEGIKNLYKTRKKEIEDAERKIAEANKKEKELRANETKAERKKRKADEEAARQKAFEELKAKIEAENAKNSSEENGNEENSSDEKGNDENSSDEKGNDENGDEENNNNEKGNNEEKRKIAQTKSLLEQLAFKFQNRSTSNSLAEIAQQLNKFVWYIQGVVYNNQTIDIFKIEENEHGNLQIKVTDDSHAIGLFTRREDALGAAGLPSEHLLDTSIFSVLEFIAGITKTLEQTTDSDFNNERLAPFGLSINDKMITVSNPKVLDEFRAKYDLDHFIRIVKTDFSTEFSVSFAVTEDLVEDISEKIGENEDSKERFFNQDFDSSIKSIEVKIKTFTEKKDYALDNEEFKEARFCQGTIEKLEIQKQILEIQKKMQSLQAVFEKEDTDEKTKKKIDKSLKTNQKKLDKLEENYNNVDLNKPTKEELEFLAKTKKTKADLQRIPKKDVEDLFSNMIENINSKTPPMSASEKVYKLNKYATYLLGRIFNPESEDFFRYDEKDDRIYYKEESIELFQKANLKNVSQNEYYNDNIVPIIQAESQDSTVVNMDEKALDTSVFAILEFIFGDAKEISVKRDSDYSNEKLSALGIKVVNGEIIVDKDVLWAHASSLKNTLKFYFENYFFQTTDNNHTRIVIGRALTEILEEIKKDRERGYTLEDTNLEIDTKKALIKERTDLLFESKNLSKNKNLKNKERKVRGKEIEERLSEIGIELEKVDTEIQRKESEKFPIEAIVPEFSNKQKNSNGEVKDVSNTPIKKEDKNIETKVEDSKKENESETPPKTPKVDPLPEESITPIDISAISVEKGIFEDSSETQSNTLGYRTKKEFLNNWKEFKRFVKTDKFAEQLAETDTVTFFGKQYSGKMAGIMIMNKMFIQYFYNREMTKEDLNNPQLFKLSSNTGKVLVAEKVFNAIPFENIADTSDKNYGKMVADFSKGIYYFLQGKLHLKALEVSQLSILRTVVTAINGKNKSTLQEDLADMGLSQNKGENSLEFTIVDKKKFKVFTDQLSAVYTLIAGYQVQNDVKASEKSDYTENNIFEVRGNKVLGFNPMLLLKIASERMLTGNDLVTQSSSHTLSVFRQVASNLLTKEEAKNLTENTEEENAVKNAVDTSEKESDILFQELAGETTTEENSVKDAARDAVNTEESTEEGTTNESETTEEEDDAFNVDDFDFSVSERSGLSVVAKTLLEKFPQVLNAIFPDTDHSSLSFKTFVETLLEKAPNQKENLIKYYNAYVEAWKALGYKDSEKAFEDVLRYTINGEIDLSDPFGLNSLDDVVKKQAEKDEIEERVEIELKKKKKENPIQKVSKVEKEKIKKEVEEKFEEEKSEEEVKQIEDSATKSEEIQEEEDKEDTQLNKKTPAKAKSTDNLKTVTPVLKAAFLNVAYKAEVVTIDGVKTVIKNDLTSEAQNNEARKLIDPKFFKNSDKNKPQFMVRIPEDVDNSKVTHYKINGKKETITFKKYCEIYSINKYITVDGKSVLNPEYLKKVPLVAYQLQKKGNEVLESEVPMFFIHDEDWYNQDNIGYDDDIEKKNEIVLQGKENVRNLRENIFKDSEGNIDTELGGVIELTERSNGHFVKVSNNKVISLREANPETIIAFGGVSSETLEYKDGIYEKTFTCGTELTNESITSGKAYDVRELNDGKKVALPVTSELLTEDVKQTIYFILKAYLNQNKVDRNVTGFIEKVKVMTNDSIDFSDLNTVEKYLKQFVYLYNNTNIGKIEGVQFDAKKIQDDINALSEDNLKTGSPYMTFIGGSLVFGVKGDHENHFLNPNSSLIRVNNSLGILYKEVLSNMYQNVDSRALSSSLPMIKAKTVKSQTTLGENYSLGIPEFMTNDAVKGTYTYTEYLKDHLKTNIVSFNVGTKEAPSYATVVQPSISFKPVNRGTVTTRKVPPTKIVSDSNTKATPQERNGHINKNTTTKTTTVTPTITTPEKSEVTETIDEKIKKVEAKRDKALERRKRVRSSHLLELNKALGTKNLNEAVIIKTKDHAIEVLNNIFIIYNLQDRTLFTKEEYQILKKIEAQIKADLNIEISTTVQIGKVYTDSMKTVANFIYGSSKNEEKEYIAKIKRPQIDENEVMIQASEVTVLVKGSETEIQALNNYKVDGVKFYQDKYLKEMQALNIPSQEASTVKNVEPTNKETPENVTPPDNSSVPSEEKAMDAGAHSNFSPIQVEVAEEEQTESAKDPVYGLKGTEYYTQAEKEIQKQVDTLLDTYKVFKNLGLKDSHPQMSNVKALIRHLLNIGETEPLLVDFTPVVDKESAFYKEMLTENTAVPGLTVTQSYQLVDSLFVEVMMEAKNKEELLNRDDVYEIVKINYDKNLKKARKEREVVVRKLIKFGKQDEYSAVYGEILKGLKEYGNIYLTLSTEEAWESIRKAVDAKLAKYTSIQDKKLTSEEIEEIEEEDKKLEEEAKIAIRNKRVQNGEVLEDIIAEEEAEEEHRKEVALKEEARRQVLEETPIAEDEETEEYIIDTDTSQNEKDYSKTSLQESGRSTTSYELRRFFIGIKEMNPNSRTSKKGFLGRNVYVGFDEVYSRLEAILSTPDEVPSNFKAMMKRLKENKKNPNWLPQVIRQLEKADTQVQNAFTYNFARHSLSMKFVMLDSSTTKKGSKKTSLKVFDTNANEVTRVITRQWENNFAISPLVEIKDGKKTINKVNLELAAKQLKMLKQLKVDKITNADLDYFFEIFGINFTDGALTEMRTRGMYLPARNGKSVKLTFDKMLHEVSKRGYGSSPFSLLENYINECLKDLNNPTIFVDVEANSKYLPTSELQSVLKSLAKLETKYNRYATTNSFRDGAKSIYGFTPTKYATDSVTRLKKSSKARKELASVPFSKNSYILNLLINDETFRDKFSIDHVGITALKKLGDKRDGDFSISKLSQADQEVTKLGMFQDTTQGGKVSTSLIFGENIEARYARMFLPTMSDKPQMLDLQTVVMNLQSKHFKTTEKGLVEGISESVMKVVREQLVVPELNRMIHTASLSNVRKMALPDYYINSSKLFWSLPALNTITVEVEYGEGETYRKVTEPLVKAIHDNPKKYTVDYILSNNEIVSAINEKLSDLIKSETSKKLSEWENYGFIERTKQKYIYRQGEKVATVAPEKIGMITSIKNLDSKYLKEKCGRDGYTLGRAATTAALDFTINSLVSNAQAQMLFSGDMALFATSKIDKFFVDGDVFKPKTQESYTIVNKDIVSVNYGKRMAMGLAPGNKLANSEGDKYLQIFLNDRFDIASNIETLVELFQDKTVDSSQLAWLKDLVKVFNQKRNKQEVDKKLFKSVIKNSKEKIKTINQDFVVKKVEEIIPYLKDYLKISVTDGQEVTTAKEHIDIIYRQGRMSEEVYNNMIDKLEAQRIEEEDTGKITKNLLTKEELKIILQPIKPVYTGSKIDKTLGISRMIYIKSSSYPLIPQLTQGTSQNDLRQNLERVQFKTGLNVRAAYVSAVKVGSNSFAVDAFDQEGNTVPRTPEEFLKGSIILDRDNFRIQNDVPVHDNHITMGTQVLKLLFGDDMDLTEDFIYNDKTYTGEELKGIFENTFGEMIAMEKANLYEELGLDENKQPKTSVENTLKNIQSLLKKEAITRGYSKQDIENLSLKAIMEDGKVVDVVFNMPLWFSSNSNRYESLLNSIVSNRLMKMKLPGYSYVVGSENGYKASTGDYEGNRIVYTSKFSGELKSFEYYDEEDIAKQDTSPQDTAKNDKELDLNYTSSKFSLTKKRNFKVLNIDGKVIEVNSIKQAAIYEVFAEEDYQKDNLTSEQKKDLRKLLTQILATTDSKKLQKLFENNFTKFLNTDGDNMESYFSEKFNVIFHSLVKGEEGWKDTLLKSKAPAKIEGREIEGSLEKRYAEELEAFRNMLQEAAEREKESSKKVRKHNLAQVLVPCKFTDNSGKTVNFFNEDGTPNTDYVNIQENGKLMLKDEVMDLALKSITSFRTPTSGHESMSEVEIVGFLPPEAGDLMIVPRTFAVQKGLDYDVDKENTYHLHTFEEEYDIQYTKGEKVSEYTHKAIRTSKKRIVALRPLFVDGKEDTDKKYIGKMVKLLHISAKELRKRRLENDFVRLHSAILSSGNPKVQKRINKILSMDFAEEQAAEIQELENRKAASKGIERMNTGDELYVKDSFSPLSDMYQKEKMALGASGNLGIGAYSVFVVMHSLFSQQKNSNSKTRVTVVNKKGEEKNAQIRIGNIVSDGVFGRTMTLGLKELMRTISEAFAERQNTATDNEKVQVLGKVNINGITINVDAVLAALGFDKDKISFVDDNGNVVEKIISLPYYLLSQPAVREYAKRASQNRAITKTSFSSEDAMEEVYAEYSTDLEEPEKIKGSLEEALLTGENLYKGVAGIGLTESQFMEVQRASLRLVKAISAVGSRFIDVQTVLNAPTRGLGRSYFDTVSKHQALGKMLSKDKTPDDVGFNISGVSEIICKELPINSMSKKEFNRYKNIGYFSNKTSVFVPNTPLGHMVYNGIIEGRDLWANYFPYNDESFNFMTANMIQNKFGNLPSPKQISEYRAKVFKEFKKYLNSFEGLNTYEVEEGGVAKERTKLCLDIPSYDYIDAEGNKLKTKGNTSLSSYLSSILHNNTYAKNLKENKLLSRFEFEIFDGERPSLIKFNNSTGSAFDEEQLAMSLFELMEENSKLPDFNGKSYSTRDLAKDLIAYSYITGGIQEAIQFIKFIPTEYLNKIGFSNVASSMENSIKENGMQELLGTVPQDNKNNLYLPSVFERQFFQNNPEEATTFKFTPHNIEEEQTVRRDHREIVKEMSEEDRLIAESIEDMEKQYNVKNNKNLEDVMQFTLSDIGVKSFKNDLDFRKIPFIKIINKDPETKKLTPYFLFEQVEVGVFKRIDLLGSFGLNEYDLANPKAASTFRDNLDNSTGSFGVIQEGIKKSRLNRKTEMKENPAYLQELEDARISDETIFYNQKEESREEQFAKEMAGYSSEEDLEYSEFEETSIETSEEVVNKVENTIQTLIETPTEDTTNKEETEKNSNISQNDAVVIDNDSLFPSMHKDPTLKDKKITNLDDIFGDVFDEFEEQMSQKKDLEDVINKSKSVKEVLQYIIDTADPRTEAHLLAMAKFLIADKNLVDNVTIKMGMPSVAKGEGNFSLVSRIKDIFRKKGVVNTQEETKEDTREKKLIVLHGMRLSSLKLAKNFNYQLPSPSLAVYNSKLNYNAIGDVSFVGDKSMVDPENEENRVYSRDAWTPTVPRSVKKANREELQKIKDEMEAIVEEMYGKGFIKDFASYDITDIFNKKAIEDNDKDLPTTGVRLSITVLYQLAYLAKKGIKVEVKKEKLATGISNRPYTQKEYETLVKIINDREKVEKFIKDFYKEFSENYYEDEFNKLFDENGKLSDFGYNKIKYDLNYYEERHKGHTDINELGATVSKLISREERNAIAEELDNRIEATTRDVFYNDEGNAIDFTPENVLDYMKNTKEKGATGGKYIHFERVLGMLSKTFTSIDEVQERENYILEEDDLNREEYYLLKELENLADEAIEAGADTRYGGGGVSRDVMKAILEFHETQNYEKAMEKDFAFAIDDPIFKVKFLDLYNKMLNPYVDYFEAKPKRMISMKDFSGVVVPDTIDESLMEELSNLGLKIVIYKRHELGARQKAVDKILDEDENGLRFSETSNNNTQEADGVYLQKANQIHISKSTVEDSNVSAYSMKEVIIHEIMHGRTSNHIDQFLNSDGSVKKGVTNIPKEVQMLVVNFHKYSKIVQMLSDYMGGADEMDKYGLFPLRYGTKDIHEFMSQMSASVTVQEFTKLFGNLDNMSDEEVIENFKTYLKRISSKDGATGIAITGKQLEVKGQETEATEELVKEDAAAVRSFLEKLKDLKTKVLKYIREIFKKDIQNSTVILEQEKSFAQAALDNILGFETKPLTEEEFQTSLKTRKILEKVQLKKDEMNIVEDMHLSVHSSLPKTHKKEQTKLVQSLAKIVENGKPSEIFTHMEKNLDFDGKRSLFKFIRFFQKNGNQISSKLSLEEIYKSVNKDSVNSIVNYQNFCKNIITEYTRKYTEELVDKYLTNTKDTSKNTEDRNFLLEELKEIEMLYSTQKNIANNTSKELSEESTIKDLKNSTTSLSKYLKSLYTNMSTRAENIYGKTLEKFENNKVIENVSKVFGKSAESLSPFSEVNEQRDYTTEEQIAEYVRLSMEEQRIKNQTKNYLKNVFLKHLNKSTLEDNSMDIETPAERLKIENTLRNIFQLPIRVENLKANFISTSKYPANRLEDASKVGYLKKIVYINDVLANLPKVEEFGVNSDYSAETPHFMRKYQIPMKFALDAYSPKMSFFIDKLTENPINEKTIQILLDNNIIVEPTEKSINPRLQKDISPLLDKTTKLNFIAKLFTNTITKFNLSQKNQELLNNLYQNVETDSKTLDTLFNKLFTQYFNTAFETNSLIYENIKSVANMATMNSEEAIFLNVLVENLPNSLERVSPKNYQKAFTIILSETLESLNIIEQQENMNNHMEVYRVEKMTNEERREHPAEAIKSLVVFNLLSGKINGTSITSIAKVITALSEPSVKESLMSIINSHSTYETMSEDLNILLSQYDNNASNGNSVPFEKSLKSFSEDTVNSNLSAVFNIIEKTLGGKNETKKLLMKFNEKLNSIGEDSLSVKKDFLNNILRPAVGTLTEELEAFSKIDENSKENQEISMDLIMYSFEEIVSWAKFEEHFKKQLSIWETYLDTYKESGKEKLSERAKRIEQTRLDKKRSALKQVAENASKSVQPSFDIYSLAGIGESLRKMNEEQIEKNRIKKEVLTEEEKADTCTI